VTRFCDALFVRARERESNGFARVRSFVAGAGDGEDERVARGERATRARSRRARSRRARGAGIEWEIRALGEEDIAK